MANAKQLNIGENRGRPRLWIEGKFLLESGWNNGDRFDVVSDPGVSLTLRKSVDGERKVAGRPDRPIIDMVGKVVESAFDCSKVKRVAIVATKTRIVIVEAQ